MIEDTLPNVGENWNPSYAPKLFSAVLLPYTAAIGVSVER